MVEANEEHTLPAAVDQLCAAVSALIDMRKEMVGGAVRAAPGLYDVLVQEIPAKSATENSRGVARSLPPAWLDAVDIKVQIDQRVKKIQPQGHSTPDRLRALAAKRYRPQDVRLVSEITAELQSWAISIRALAEPAHIKEVAAPCPRCGKRWHYKQHAGETVRTAALQLNLSQGCTCLSCHVFYPPDKFLWLARLLGHDTPAGVVLE